MHRLVALLCAIFAISPFLSGAAHTRAHAEELHHVMPIELHFVALGISSPTGLVKSVVPFVRLVSGPPSYRGPIRLKDPDPERISA